MAWWNFIFGGASELVKAGKDVYTAIEGDQAARDQQLSSEQIALFNAYAAEFVARQQRTPWDSFVDGINRLIRPCLAIGALSTLGFAVVDPVLYAETMRALALTPEWIGIIIGGIFTFFFSGRIIEKLPRKWKIEPDLVEAAKQIAIDRAARQASSVVDDSSSKEVVVTESVPTTYEEKEVNDYPDVYAGAVDNSTSPERAMAATIWGEARGESLNGKIAVGWVIRNRASNPAWWGKDIIGVCLAPRQFTCWHDQQAEKVRWVDERNEKFVVCLDVARRVIAGDVPDPTAGADHYYADYIATPRWAKNKSPTTKIGRHIFYRLGPVG